MELTEPELSALVDQLDMRPGHQKKMARLLNELRKGSNNDEANRFIERLEDGQMDQQIAGAPTDPRDLPRSVIHVIFITFAFSIVV